MRLSTLLNWDWIYWINCINSEIEVSPVVSCVLMPVYLKHRFRSADLIARVCAVPSALHWIYPFKSLQSWYRILGWCVEDLSSPADCPHTSTDVRKIPSNQMTDEAPTSTVTPSFPSHFSLVRLMWNMFLTDFFHLLSPHCRATYPCLHFSIYTFQHLLSFLDHSPVRLLVPRLILLTDAPF